ncbi:MAG: hypothetical protein JWL99_4942 [Streptomyces oryziradicis]|nr:hypothetical protein [Actinacidiphila oryziradicis]
MTTSVEGCVHACVVRVQVVARLAAEFFADGCGLGVTAVRGEGGGDACRVPGGEGGVHDTQGGTGPRSPSTMRPAAKRLWGSLVRRTSSGML